jgi:hypothetical protein
MHMHFTALEVIWTLTFAALLVLLVVLLGRDRARRYPFFTAGIVMAALEMLMRRLLASKLAPLTATKLFLALADLGFIITLLVVIELARRAFPRAARTAWIVAAVGVIAVAVATLAWWGPWPARETLTAHSLLAHLRLMQLLAEKGDLFNNLALIELTLIAIFTGRRFHAGWRSHARQLLTGYSVAALAQVAVRLAWEKLARAPQPSTEAEYNHHIAIQNRLLDANSLVYLVVVIAWIACLWFDDPDYTPAAQPALPEIPPPDSPPPAIEKTLDDSTMAAALRRAIGHDAEPSAKPNPGKPADRDP